MFNRLSTLISVQYAVCTLAMWLCCNFIFIFASFWYILFLQMAIMESSNPKYINIINSSVFTRKLHPIHQTALKSIRFNSFEEIFGIKIFFFSSSCIWWNLNVKIATFLVWFFKKIDFKLYTLKQSAYFENSKIIMTV